jgi:hypothetical protein
MGGNGRTTLGDTPHSSRSTVICPADMKKFQGPMPKLSKSRQSRDFHLDNLTPDERLERCLTLFDEIGIDPPSHPESSAEWEFRCPHPDHDDRRPSCSLNWTKLTFYCQSCHWGDGTGILEFITVTTGRSISEAIEFMQTGCGHPGSGAMQPKKVEEPQTYLSLSSLDDWRSITVEAASYLLNDRRIPAENIIRHELGFDSQLDCITCPIFEYRDGQKLLPGRQLWRFDGTEPKYQSVPKGIQVGQLLYNAHVRSPKTVVVEAPLSVVSKSHLDDRYGFVACFGGPKTGQYPLLAQYPSLYLFFDNDDAGFKHADDVGRKLKDHTIYVVSQPYKMPDDDVDDDVDRLSDATVLQLLAEAVPYQKWVRANASRLNFLRQQSKPKQFRPAWTPYNH